MDANLILATANKVLAKGIILIHNHPSGNLMPSGADDKMTAKIKNAAELLDISLLDHIILTKDGFYSYAMEGKMERGGKTSAGLKVQLSAGINPDDYQRGNVRQPIKPKMQSVDSFEEASRVVNRFISENDLGAGNWTGGAIYKDGKQVAYVSYNGRVWSGVPNSKAKSKLLCESQRDKMAKGGTTQRITFKQKVDSIKKKLLKNKKVPKAVQKDYGNTFSPDEAEDSAKRIVGAQKRDWETRKK
jgi:hypothetical protein